MIVAQLIACNVLSHLPLFYLFHFLLFPLLLAFFSLSFWSVSFGYMFTFLQYLIHVLWREQYRWLVDDLYALRVQLCIGLNKRFATNDTGKHYSIVLDTQQVDFNSVHSFKCGCFILLVMCPRSLKWSKWTLDREAVLLTSVHALCSKLFKDSDKVWCLWTNILTCTLANWLPS